MFCCVSLKMWVHCVYCIHEKINKAIFCIHCLKHVYIMLQVGTIAYMMITDKSLILRLEITAYTAYAEYKEKIEKRHVFRGYIRPIPQFYKPIQIGTHQRFCLQLVFHIWHLRERGHVGTLRTLLTSESRKRLPFVKTKYIVYNFST